jgi:uncharacterized protein
MPSASVVSAPTRLCYAALGWGAVAFAMAGLMVPGLPTTVFVLIASYCFSKSSPRFSRWLWEHRWLGPTLRRYARDGGMSRSAKRATLIAMWTSVLVSAALLLQLHAAIAIATIGLGLLGTLAILFAVRTVPGD